MKHPLEKGEFVGADALAQQRLPLRARPRARARVRQRAGIVVRDAAQVKVRGDGAAHAELLLHEAGTPEYEVVVEACLVERGLRFEELAVDDAPRPYVGRWADFLPEVDFGGAVGNGLHRAFDGGHDDAQVAELGGDVDVVVVVVVVGGFWLEAAEEYVFHFEIWIHAVSIVIFSLAKKQTCFMEKRAFVVPA